MASFYNQADQDIYTGGDHFIPQEQYRLGNFNVAPPSIANAPNTGGITNTNVSMPYMGYPSYEAYLAATQGAGGDGGGGDEEDGGYAGLGMSPGALGGKIPGVTGWANRAFGNIKHAYSKVPSIAKGITWGFNKISEMNKARKAKKEQELKEEIKSHNIQSAISTRADKSGATHGGFTNPGKGSYGPHKAEGGIVGLAQGGRIGYNRGRVVNPGGYAGDEGGILEWIKSIAGPESESNPTAFGTQDSLLNQGSIGQLQDAIKSYEALMMMGELDEEQQADYELKLQQLSALTEGAEQKAHGGRVGFKYGGLASIL